MSVRMKAIRACYNPAERREYREGAEFTVDGEAEAQRLERRKRAVRLDTRPGPTDLPARTARVVNEGAPPKRSGESRRRYQRRDMQATDGQAVAGPTGAEISPPSSDQAPQPETPASTPSEDAPES